MSSLEYGSQLIGLQLAELSAALTANWVRARNSLMDGRDPGDVPDEEIAVAYMKTVGQSADMADIFSRRFAAAGADAEAKLCQAWANTYRDEYNSLSKAFDDPEGINVDFWKRTVSTLATYGDEKALDKLIGGNAGSAVKRALGLAGTSAGVAVTLFDVCSAWREGDGTKFAGMAGSLVVGSMLTKALLSLVVVSSFPAAAAALVIGVVGFVATIASEVVEEGIDGFLELFVGPDEKDVAAMVSAAIMGSGTADLVNLGHRLTFGTVEADVLIGSSGESNAMTGGSGEDIIHGANLEDFISGGEGEDSLYGESGNDVLMGGRGDDTLSGGGGSDKLEGGEGLDTYSFTYSDFFRDARDTIFDSDGVGRIMFDGVDISDMSASGAISQVGIGGFYWRTSGGVFNILVSEPDAEGGRTLNIVHRETGGRILVQQWQQGDLGFVLPEYRTQPLYGGTLSRHTAGDDLVGYDGDDNPATPVSGNEVIETYMGNDGIDGGYGDDTIDSGSGDDLVFGGPGKSVITTADGNDIVINSSFVMDWDPWGDPLSLGYELKKNVLLEGVEFYSAGNGWIVFNGSGGEVDHADMWGRFYGMSIQALTSYSSPAWMLLDPNEHRDGDDQIDVGDGHDTVYAGHGSDRVFGGQGKDILVGGHGDDMLDGGSDDDLLMGDVVTGGDSIFRWVSDVAADDARPDGDDILSGGEGNDTVFGQGGSDFLYGGGGDDTLWGDRMNLDNDSAHYAPGQAGADYLDGGAGDDDLIGNAGNDHLVGGLGNDNLFGDDQATSPSDHGDDTLDGGDGDDYLAGEGGSDTLRGGAGSDEVLGDSVELDGAHHGDDKLLGGSGADRMLGGGGNDAIYGDDGDDIIIGDGELAAMFHGNDLLDGGEGSDQLQGGGGNDLLDGGEGDDLLFGDAGDDRLIGNAGEDQLVGGEGGDVLSGGKSHDQLWGEAGNDSLDGEEGNDILWGGSGSDQLVGGSGADDLHGDIGEDALYGGADEDMLSGGNDADVLDGGSADDQLFGGAGDDVIRGAEGADYLEGGIGNDYLDGGAGVDVYHFDRGFGVDTIDEKYFSPGSADIISFGEGILPSTLEMAREQDSLVITISGTSDQLRLENYFGSWVPLGFAFATGTSLEIADFYEKLPISPLATGAGLFYSGSGGDDALFGTAVRDGLYGGSGSDYLIGGAGDDLLYGDQWRSPSDREVTNYKYDDTLLGGVGNDTLFGDRGSDILRGGEGDDGLHGGQDGDFLDGGGGNDSLDGGGGSDQLSGGDGADSLRGGSGDDHIDGGAGNDEIVGGSGLDRIIFSLGSGHDNVYGSSTFNIVGDQSDIVIFGDGISRHDVSLVREADSLRVVIDSDNSLTIDDYYGWKLSVDKLVFEDGEIDFEQNVRRSGTSADDTIEGAATNDQLFGADGADIMQGGAGNDYLAGGRGADTLRGGEGDDVLSADNLMNVINPDDRDVFYDHLYGGGGDDHLYADSGGALLDGGAGNDYLYGGGDHQVVLIGGDGNDEIYAGDGGSLITGGSGDDVIMNVGEDTTMIFSGSFGNDLVSGFSQFGGGAAFEFSSIQAFEQLHITVDFEFTSEGTHLIEKLVAGSMGTVELYRRFGEVSIGIGNDQRVLLTENFHSHDWWELASSFGATRLIYGFSGDDQLSGGAGGEVIYGGIGDDLLSGGAGDDVYLAEAGGGHDIIDNSGGGNDVVYLKGLMDLSSIGFSREGDDLIISVDPGQNNTIRVADHFLGGDSAIDYVHSEGGAALSTAAINSLVDGGSGDDPGGGIPGNGSDYPNLVDGTPAGEQLLGSNGRDMMRGVGGDDILFAFQGDDKLEGGDGNDDLYGGNGSFSGSGNDILVGGSGSDSLKGEDGDDFLVGGSGDDSYYYAAGSGSDTIDNRGGGMDYIYFAGIGPDRLSFHRDGDDLIVRVDGDPNEQTRVLKHFQGGECAIAFVQPGVPDTNAIPASQFESLLTPLNGMASASKSFLFESLEEAAGHGGDQHFRYRQAGHLSYLDLDNGLFEDRLRLISNWNRQERLAGQGLSVPDLVPDPAPSVNDREVQQHVAALRIDQAWAGNSLAEMNRELGLLVEALSSPSVVTGSEQYVPDFTGQDLGWSSPASSRRVVMSERAPVMMF